MKTFYNKTNKIIVNGVIFTLVLAFVLSACAFSISDAKEIEEAFLLENQWYADAEFLNYDATINCLANQNITKNKEYLKENPIIIAVIDTGIDFTHPVFKNLVYKNISEINGENKTDDDGNGFIDDYYGWNFVEDNNVIYDDCTLNDSHGTHVSGIIAQQILAYGLSDYVKILPIKAGADSGRGTEFKIKDAKRAIEYARLMKADVINMSFGTYGINSGLFGRETGWGKGSTFEKLINSTIEDDIIICAAAGNDGKKGLNEKSKFYPAAFSGVFGIMAYDNTNNIAKFSSKGSNYGNCYDLIAPGKDIYSTLTNNRYDNKSGTSMACPIVSAMTGMLLVKYNRDAGTVKEIIKNFEPEKIGVYKKASFFDMLNYIPIEQIEIETDSELSQKLNNLSCINCSAKVFIRKNNQSEAVLEPENSPIYDSIEWLIFDDSDKKVYSEIGKTLNYLPENAGKFKIVAKTESSSKHSNEIKFDVDYLKLNELSPKPKGQTTLRVGDSGKYYVEGFKEYLNPNDIPKFYWYVNGNLDTSSQDCEFLFTPEKHGDYKITCKIIDGKTVAEYNVKVGYGNDEIGVIIACSLGALILVVLLILVITNKINRKNRK